MTKFHSVTFKADKDMLGLLLDGYFTREEVAVLLDVITLLREGRYPTLADTLDALADKIEALLPPEFG